MHPDSRVLSLAELAKRIARTSDVPNQRIVITIDGPAGAGKTTLAQQLSELLSNAPVVHMDWLYAGWKNALEADLWKRLERDILNPWLQGESATFATFDWQTETFAHHETIQSHRALIVEGVGASHPLIRQYATLSIWVEAPDELLLDRVLNRDGEHLRDHMLIWQQDEWDYFEQHDIRGNSDVIYVGMNRD